MADENKSPLAAVMANVPTIDLSKVNPTGIGTNPEITAEYRNLMEAQKKYADELEQRYAQPNWFKVAAGFAKPQLGGFLASLGSASQAMGENVEQQRAIAPTVAAMRAEIAKGNIGLTQGLEAAKINERVFKENRVHTPAEAAAVEALTKGPGGVSAAGQNISTAQTNQLAQALASGMTYVDLVAKFPKSFVDSTVPILLQSIPGLKAPPGMPGAGGAPAGGAAPAAEPATGGHIPGVPASMSQSMPVGPQVGAQAQSVEAIQVQRDKINSDLTQQASAAVPIFEVSTNLYKAGSNPDLAPAFGVFEKGDPLSIIGKALESGSFPAVIANMRQYIIQARLGGDRQKRALSDLQAMEGALADLQTKMQQGIVNPTDVRTMFESESVPGTRSTQDAFLRGIARIGSDALARYELKSSFDKALQDKNFNAMSWTSSPYFSNVQENAKKRTQSLITNPATDKLPVFMQKGLSGAYSYSPTGSAGASRPTERTVTDPNTGEKVTIVWDEASKTWKRK